uniref:Cytochrome P450 n=1 Tax=Kalanchoe fedtschenkoi TaxID=63787 RepID=A0A7N0RDX2_KALFE
MLLPANSLMYSEAAFLAISLLTYCLCRFIFSNRWKKAGAGDHDHPLPPGPSPWPVVGCLPQMLKASNKYKWIFGLMKDLNTDIACIRIGNVHVIPVTSPEIASQFLKEKDALFASRPKSTAAALISHNYKGTVLSQKGNQWAKMRKMLTADLFSPTVHKWLHDKRVEEADNLICYVRNQQDGIVDLRKTTLFYSANVIRKLMFNRRYFYEAMPGNGPGVAEEEHANGVVQSLKYVFANGLSDFFPLLTGIDLDGKEKKAKDANKILEKHQNPIIDERIEKWRGGSTLSEEALEEDMLDIMINLKDSNGEPLLSGEEIKATLGTAMTVMLLARLLQAFQWSLPPGVTKVDLVESEDDLFLASPLVARAAPRLSPHLYQFENV